MEISKHKATGVHCSILISKVSCYCLVRNDKHECGSPYLLHHNNTYMNILIIEGIICNPVCFILSLGFVM